MEDNKQDTNIEKLKKKFSFKAYMDTHPESKQRHKNYVSAKVECDCGRTVSRGNLSKHKLTSVHTTALCGIKSVKQKGDVVDDLKMEKILLEIESIKKLLTDHNKEV